MNLMKTQGVKTDTVHEIRKTRRAERILNGKIKKKVLRHLLYRLSNENQSKL